MGIGLAQYRACVGIFNSVIFKSKTIFVSFVSLFSLLYHMFSLLASCFDISTVRSNLLLLQYFYTLFCFSILLQSWDIETNPGPTNGTLSICQWNLNSVWVDDFSKISQITAFLEVYKFDIVCLSETFLESSIENDDHRLEINGYTLLRCNHLSNTKRGGVCIYYKNHLALLERPDLTFLDECLVCEIKTGSSRTYLCHCYRSPSQSPE